MGAILGISAETVQRTQREAMRSVTLSLLQGSYVMSAEVNNRQETVELNFILVASCCK